MNKELPLSIQEARDYLMNDLNCEEYLVSELVGDGVKCGFNWYCPKRCVNEYGNFPLQNKITLHDLGFISIELPDYKYYKLTKFNLNLIYKGICDFYDMKDKLEGYHDN